MHALSLAPAGSDTSTPPATALDQKMMARALELAHKAWEAEEVPVGCVIYRGEEIVGEGYNLRESEHDPTAHAEIIAMRQASTALQDWRLTDCTLVVTLEPCTMCAGAIVNGRVGRLIYGASDAKAGGVESLYAICDDERLNHRPEIVRGVMARECRTALRDFFKERRRINKKARRAAG